MCVRKLSALAIGLAVAACAGRDPELIATVQPWDQTASCTQIRAEIEANNVKVKELADEQGWKAAQNVVTGVAAAVLIFHSVTPVTVRMLDGQRYLTLQAARL